MPREKIQSMLVAPRPGRPDWAIFDQLGYFLRAQCDFFEKKSSLKKWRHFGHNFLRFHLNELFQNNVCILAFFGSATVLAIFKKIGRVFSNLWVTLAMTPSINDTPHNGTKPNNGTACFKKCKQLFEY
jgi:hypothetical protein